MHMGISNDIKTREDNIKAGRTLCSHCSGTGNELYSMYRACPRCDAKGYIPDPTIRVYRIDACTWFAGESLSECIKEAAQCYDIEVDGEEVGEVSDVEMKRLKYYDDVKNEHITFAEQLARMIKAGETFPTVFASTEY